MIVLLCFQKHVGQDWCDGYSQAASSLPSVSLGQIVEIGDDPISPSPGHLIPSDLVATRWLQG